MNTSQSNSAQNSEQKQDNDNLGIDFSHRLAGIPTACEIDLVDTIALMTERAESVLVMLSGHFNGQSSYRLTDSIVAGVIEAALQEVRDIDAVVRGYHLAENAKNQA